MPSRSVRHTPLTAVVGLATCLAACSFGESGVEPPTDRIFLPAGLVADPVAGRWLYTVNSNSDLRFNAGTVVAVDTERAAADRVRTDWAICPTAGYTPNPAYPATCCYDFFDNRVLNCDDRQYIDAKSTLRIGSFGGSAVFEKRDDLPGLTGRLYFSVRSEPSITFIDVASTTQTLKLSCGAEGTNSLCDDAHKIRGDYDNAAFSALKLLEEPQTLTIDPLLRLLYVGHLLEGISLIDTCGDKPTLLSINQRIFSSPGYGVTSLSLGKPGDAAAPIYATGRNYGGRASEVQALALRGIKGGCGPSRTGAELISTEGFFSSAFFSDGSDIRAMVESRDKSRVYLLHRNSFLRQSPPAVVEVDRRDDGQGRPRNQAVGLVEICAGATEMHLHDAGRGDRLYVVCFEAGQIYVIDPAPLSVVGIINVGRGPTTLVFGKGDPGTAYVAGFSDNNVSVLDLAPGSPNENRVIQRIGFPQLRKL